MGKVSRNMWSGNSTLRKTFLMREKHVHNILRSLRNHDEMLLECCDIIVFSLFIFLFFTKIAKFKCLILVSFNI